MNNEILIMKGRLADLEKQEGEIQMKAESYLIQIRELLDPYAEFLDLELTKAFLLVKDFRELQIEAREINTKIKQLKENLGL